MKWITKLAHSWGQEKLKGLDFNPYPNTNILHKSKLVSAGSPGHKILCYDPSGRYKDFEVAWRKLPKRQRESVEVKFIYGNAVTDEGKSLTNKQLANVLGISPTAFQSNIKYALKRIENYMEKA